MLKLFLIIVAILLPAILFMGFRVFFTQKGKFPNSHVEGNKGLRKHGIGCVKSQDRIEQKRKNIFEIE
ncbi:MAG: hypothetical protein J6V62_02855 [Paludibacteraceae bacterium]|jgi:hypothetical protein|nr:hypothetical protein [Paludibacteraceae bacterium]